MAILSLRILDNATLSAGSSLSAVVDLGEYLSLDVVGRVAQAGTADATDDGAAGTATLVVEHAPVDEDAAYLALPQPAEIDLTTAGNTWVHADHYTRYVRVTLTGRLSADAVVTLDLVAKR